MSDTFHVMFQTVPPRPSWMAWRHKSFGTLNITADHARFVPRKGEPVLIEHVFRVSRGWKQSSRGAWIPPAMDTYIEVLYGDRSEPRAAYINDGRWFGLAVYIPNRRLLHALTALQADESQ
jgi:hypothetical protein